jgi:hypothetical protein
VLCRLAMLRPRLHLRRAVPPLRPQRRTSAYVAGCCAGEAEAEAEATKVGGRVLRWLLQRQLKMLEGSTAS